MLIKDANWMAGAKLKGHEVFAAGIATHFVPSEKMNALEKDLSGKIVNGCLHSSVLIVYQGVVTDQDVSAVLHSYHVGEHGAASYDLHLVSVFHFYLSEPHSVLSY